MADAPEVETEVSPRQGQAAARPAPSRHLPAAESLHTGVLFGGFFAIVQAMNGRFEIGCIAIFVAMVLDGMDGRVARWIQHAERVGAQYDSIADMVAVRRGAGPGRLHLGAQSMGTLAGSAPSSTAPAPGFGWRASTPHLGGRKRTSRAAGALGAAVMAGLVWVLTDFGFEPEDAVWLPGLTWRSPSSPASPWCPTCPSGASRK